MKFLTRLCAAAAFGLAGVCTSHAADRAIIVLDASGSMWGQIGGKPKLEIARETLKSVLQSVPADMELGLMAYGHRQKGSCQDIELVVPPATGTSAAISEAAGKMKFLGKTPLSEAVKKAAEDLKYTEDKATVILITDGLETCNADPCAVGRELEQSGVDFTAHVVGFGLTEEEGRQVACLAENTGGKYIQASDAGTLEEALRTTVVAAPEPAPEPAPAPPPAVVEHNYMPKAVLSAGGEPSPSDVYFEIFRANAAGEAGDRVEGGYNDYKAKIDAGDYVMTAVSGAASAEQKLTVSADKASEPVFDLNAGVLILRARPAPGADIDGNAQIIIDHPGDGASSANYGEVKFVVPAGETKVTVKLGAGEIEETIQLAAGQTVDKDIIVGVGKLVANAAYSAGGETVVSGDLSWKVFKAKKKLDGSREQVSYGFGPAAKFDLPAGDYVATVDMQAVSREAPLSVAVGELTEINVDLNAGVVAITAPGADGYRIYEAKKNLQGERRQVTYGFGEEFTQAIGAGDYVVVTDFKADKADSETPFTIKAGERTEIAIP
ncbi:MAG: VWA domain-containing protein [Mesorhizobium sp.]